MPDVVIEAKDIRKDYGHVQALRGADLQIRAGEVVGLVGDNGAGKSTLMKIMCGAEQPDGGDIEIRGRRVDLPDVRVAHTLGIEAVYQDLALAPDLSVEESIFLGHEPTVPGWRRWIGWLDKGDMAREAREALERLAISLPTTTVKIQALSGGQRQAVAIARAVRWAESAILMDEPTAALGTRQTELVTGIIRAAAEQGLGVCVISHDMPRMLRLADRIVVMRLGRVVADFPASEASIELVVGAMLGSTVLAGGGADGPA